MRTAPTQEEAQDVLDDFFPFFRSVMKEALSAYHERKNQDMDAQHTVHQEMFRAWDMYRYSLNIFSRRLAEHPELELVKGSKSYGINCRAAFEIWVKKVDKKLNTSNNHTPTSKARLHNEPLPGLTLPTLVLGYRVNTTGTELADLQLICRGRNGELIWHLDLLSDASSGTGPLMIPFAPTPDPVTPGIQRVMEIRAELKKNKKKKEGNDGSGE